jgi:hypothetical protein
MTEEELGRLQRNALEVLRLDAEAQVNQYFALTSQRERTVFLDGIADELSRGRRQVAAETPVGAVDGPGLPPELPPGLVAEPGTPSSLHGPGSPADWAAGFASAMKQQIESVTPEQRARNVQFMMDVRDRMAQRGLQLPASPPPGALPPPG